MQLTRLLLVFSVLASALAAFAQNTAPAADAKGTYVHRLQLADKVRIGIYQEEDLTTTARVDSRGLVDLPLVGEVQIGSMTVAEAAEVIKNRYREGRFLRNPQVTVSVEEYAPREVSIQGQIRSPGRYSLPNESTFTVVELVTKAGGFTDIAKGTAVTVRRTLADGSTTTFVVDAESIIKGKRSDAKLDAANILLLPGDIVNVPERLI